MSPRQLACFGGLVPLQQDDPLVPAQVAAVLSDGGAAAASAVLASVAASAAQAVLGVTGVPPPVPAPMPVKRDKPLRDKPVGITLVTRNGITQWQAQLTHKGTNFYLGTHVTADAAARAYDAKARDLGW
jgi:hypothetical protein